MFEAFYKRRVLNLRAATTSLFVGLNSTQLEEPVG